MWARLRLFPLHFLHGAATPRVHRRPHQCLIEDDPSPRSPILSLWCEWRDVHFLESSGLSFVDLSLPVPRCLFLSSVPNYLIYVSACLVSLPWVTYSMLPLSEMPHFHHENITDSSTAWSGDNLQK